jgi:hypothetical protein
VNSNFLSFYPLTIVYGLLLIRAKQQEFAVWLGFAVTINQSQGLPVQHVEFDESAVTTSE